MCRPLIVLFACFILLSACETGSGREKLSGPANTNNSLPTEDTTREKANAAGNSIITYEIIDAPEGTFGYDILMDGKVMIHQPNVPGMPGLKGFIKKEDAAKVAELVIGKLKNNQMPPTVTIEELQEIMAEVK